jgi:hypothetical protein
LIQDEQVKEVIKAIGKRSKCKRKVLEEMLQEWTMRSYRFDEVYTEERYINLIKKYLGRKLIGNSTENGDDFDE